MQVSIALTIAAPPSPAIVRRVGIAVGAVAAHVRLILWCKSCNHRAEPDLASLVAQHGSGTTVIDWARLLRCTECGARDADFVVAGGERWK
jgi:hypothetical protein